jgi:hypothetical protein
MQGHSRSQLGRSGNRPNVGGVGDRERAARAQRGGDAQARREAVLVKAKVGPGTAEPRPVLTLDACQPCLRLHRLERACACGGECERAACQRVWVSVSLCAFVYWRR